MEPKTLKIGSRVLKNRYVLGPYGFNDIAYRILSSQYGASLVTTDPVCLADLSQEEKIRGFEAETESSALIAWNLDVRSKEEAMELVHQIHDRYRIDFLCLDATRLKLDLIKEILRSLTEFPVLLALDSSRDIDWGNPMLKFPVVGIFFPEEFDEDITRKLNVQNIVPFWQPSLDSQRFIDDIRNSGLSFGISLNRKASGHPIVFEDRICKETRTQKVRTGLIRQGEDLRKYIELSFDFQTKEEALKKVKSEFAGFVSDFVQAEDVNKAICQHTEKEQFLETACEIEYK